MSLPLCNCSTRHATTSAEMHEKRECNGFCCSQQLSMASFKEIEWHMTAIPSRMWMLWITQPPFGLHVAMNIALSGSGDAGFGHSLCKWWAWPNRGCQASHSACDGPFSNSRKPWEQSWAHWRYRAGKTISCSDYITDYNADYINAIFNMRLLIMLMLYWWLIYWLYQCCTSWWLDSLSLLVLLVGHRQLQNLFVSFERAYSYHQCSPDNASDVSNFSAVMNSVRNSWCWFAALQWHCLLPLVQTWLTGLQSTDG